MPNTQGYTLGYTRCVPQNSWYVTKNSCKVRNNNRYNMIYIYIFVYILCNYTPPMNNILGCTFNILDYCLILYCSTNPPDPVSQVRTGGLGLRLTLYRSIGHVGHAALAVTGHVDSKGNHTRCHQAKVPEGPVPQFLFQQPALLQCHLRSV